MEKDRQLKRLLFDLTNGYSKNEFLGKTIYFKHLGILDQSKLDIDSSAFYDDALAKGLETEKTRLQAIHETREWTDNEELELKQVEFDKENAEKVRRHLSMPSQMQDNRKFIEECNQKIREIQARKMEKVGLTAETFSTSKTNEAYIYHSSYSDANLKTYFFTDEEYDQLTRKELNSLVMTYNDSVMLMSPENIRKLGFSIFFYQYFATCGQNPLTFYGKPSIQMTFYQTLLFREASTFDQIMKSGKEIPEDIMDNPEKIIDWVTMSGNIKEVLESGGEGEGGAKAIFGATPQDMKDLGLDKTGKKNLKDLVPKEGLNIMDMIKLGL